MSPYGRVYQEYQARDLDTATQCNPGSSPFPRKYSSYCTCTFPSTCPLQVLVFHCDGPRKPTKSLFSLTSVGCVRDFSPEVAWQLFSGGYSNLFNQPDYQGLAVNNYFTGLLGNLAGLFNRTGSGYPEVEGEPSTTSPR
ncbi:hypothetical protein BN946_scf184881.g2 [Trametes cinnabarina]|uniref:Uncharacterized protein n=1 Tax=Pycnoporus cinnabarinus TaxID=5643 RepID=A0A060SYX3_PYCCI|nr:hypothetical protein BN946_scf184881.g2 [Trametes cinnabarina]